LQDLEARDQAILRQWQMRLERADYEAALAERRYQEVDPSQRLVAATLERRWNDALLQQQELKRQAAEFQRQEARVATSEQKAKVLALARDLPRLWHAPTTPAKDRKRMLRLLIRDITVEKPSARKQLVAHIRWQGGACSDLNLQLPPNIADRVRYPATVVDRVRNLTQSLPNAEIAERLNREGYVSALGKPFTGSMIQWIRYRYQIPQVTLACPEELTVEQVAKRFGVSPNVVYYWIDRSVIRARRLNAGAPYWITLDEADEQKLRDWVGNSCRIHTASSMALEEGAL
jgi:DNA-binding transcriptional MerR regulator